MTTVDIGQRLVPALLVRDMNETLAFYRKLGFVLTGLYVYRATGEFDRANAAIVARLGEKH